MTRTCPTCKGPIHRRSDRAIYCSAACKDARNNALKSSRRAAEPAPPSPADQSF